MALSDIKGCEKNGKMVTRKCMYQMEAKIKCNMATKKKKRGESKHQSTMEGWISTGKLTAHSSTLCGVGAGAQTHLQEDRK